MDRRDRRKKFADINFDHLEGRVVLSAVTHIVPPAPGQVVGVSSQVGHPSTGALIQGVRYFSFNGTAAGKASHVLTTIPDTPSVVAIKGTAHLSNDLTFALTGNLRGTGFIAQGQLSGTIRLTNGKDSLTLELTGPKVKGFTPPSSGTYQYTIVKGTGIYAHDVGHGTVDVGLAAHTFQMNFHLAPNNA